MRASTVVAILSLAAGIAPSVALPLPAIESRVVPPRKPTITFHDPHSPTKDPKDDRPPSIASTDTGYFTADSHHEQGHHSSWGGGSMTVVNTPTTPHPHGADSKPPSEHPESTGSQHSPSDPGPAPPTASEPAKPKPIPPAPKAAISEVFKSAVSTGIATGIIASSNAIGQPPSRRELLERFDEQIKLAARAYVRKLLTTPMVDLD